MLRTVVWSLVLVVVATCNRFDPRKPHVELVYRASGTDIEATMAVLRRRLDHLQVPSAVATRGPLVVVKVDARADLDRVERVLGKRALLELVPVDDSEAAHAAMAAITLPPGVRLESVVSTATGRRLRLDSFIAESPAALQPLAALIPAQWRFGVLATTADGGGSRFEGLLLAAERPVSNQHVRTANVAFDETGKPLVEASFTDEGAQLLDRMSGANLGRRMAILLDGAIMMAPIIISRIPEGRVHINLGAMEPQDARAEAEAVVTVLKAGGLPAPIALLRKAQVPGQ